MHCLILQHPFHCATNFQEFCNNATKASDSFMLNLIAMTKPKLLFLAYVLGILLPVTACRHQTPDSDVGETVELLQEFVIRYDKLCNEVSQQQNPLPVTFPRSFKPDGSVRLTGPADMTSGYFAGILWMMLDFAKEEKWKERALKYTRSLEDQLEDFQNPGYAQKVLFGFGQAYSHTGDLKYFRMAEGASRILSADIIDRLEERDKSPVGQEWLAEPELWGNVELLAWSFQQTQDPVYLNVARLYADKALAHLPGQMVSLPVAGNRETELPSDIPPRSLARAALGFLTLYEVTKNQEYLMKTRLLADLYIAGASADSVQVRTTQTATVSESYIFSDTEAAAVITCVLATLSLHQEEKDEYERKATDILRILSSTFRDRHKTRQEGIVSGTLPPSVTATQEETLFVITDYYYARALLTILRNDALKS